MSLLCRLKNLVHKGLLKKEDLDRIVIIPKEPSDDTVSRGVFEQIKWERDVAIEQLEELGYGLGQKIEPCEDCISKNKVLEGKVIHQSCDGVEIINSYVVPVEYIEQLHSVKPKTDVLDKIRAEIVKKHLSIAEKNDFDNGRTYGYEEVLEIIDKYKTGSEDMSEVGVEIVKTEENEKSGIKYLNINVSNSEVERKPDIVRLCADAGVIEYMKQKTGEWIADDDGPHMCSCCKVGDRGLKGTEKYCPNCGAMMLESQESEEKNG